jgi:hypothetical protein
MLKLLMLQKQPDWPTAVGTHVENVFTGLLHAKFTSPMATTMIIFWSVAEGTHIHALVLTLILH